MPNEIAYRKKYYLIHYKNCNINVTFGCIGQIAQISESKSQKQKKKFHKNFF